jgi:hypothetical protein
LDGFGGGLITEQIAMGWVGDAVNAASLLLGIEPALAWFVEIVKGPVAGVDAVLQGAADRGLIKRVLHDVCAPDTARLPSRLERSRRVVSFGMVPCASVGLQSGTDLGLHSASGCQQRPQAFVWQCLLAPSRISCPWCTKFKN